MGNAPRYNLKEHEFMVELALMTVEITLVDKNKTIAIGGPPDQAIAMQSKLAKEMDLPLPKEDALLLLTLETKDFLSLVAPTLREFPDLGWCFIDEKRNFMENLGLFNSTNKQEQNNVQYEKINYQIVGDAARRNRTRAHLRERS
jgi:hypothetical protein